MSTSTKRQDYITWDEYFMGVAMLSGMRSKDPNTQVGACIVSPEHKILSMGYNGFPLGCYVTLFPCNECAKAIIQTGIREVVYDSDKYEHTQSVIASKKMLKAAGVTLRRYEHTDRMIHLKL